MLIVDLFIAVIVGGKGKIDTGEEMRDAGGGTRMTWICF
jgi:hypothetical protein